MVDMVADSQRAEQKARPQALKMFAQRRGEGAEHPIVRAPRTEQFGRAGIAAMRCLQQGKVDGIRTDDGTGGTILGPAQRHIVDVRGQSLVELAGKREAGRPCDIAGEAGQDRDPVAGPRPRGQQPADREGGIVEMR